MGVKHSRGCACAQDASWTANLSEVVQSWCHLPRLSPISFIVSMKTTTALQAAAHEEVSYMNFIMQQNCWPQISLQNREKSYLGGRWGRIIISEKIRVKIESSLASDYRFFHTETLFCHRIFHALLFQIHWTDVAEQLNPSPKTKLTWENIFDFIALL